MTKKLTLSIVLSLVLIFSSALTAQVSYAESIDAAELTSVDCEGFTIGTKSDLGTVDFQFSIQSVAPAGPVVLVSGSFLQTVAKPTAQFTTFSWGSFPNVYVVGGKLIAGQYVIVNSPADDPIGRTVTLVGWNTIPLHYSAGPIECAAVGGEGCTPGYWKQSQHFINWTGYSPTDLFDSVFGVTAFPGKTLLEVLEQGGGGAKALGRYAVAALLNATSPDVNFAYTWGEVITIVQDAFATEDYKSAKKLLGEADEAYCPL